MCWDTIVQAEELGVGRDPKLSYQHAKEFFRERQEREQAVFS
jgi:hypothetical protein